MRIVMEYRASAPDAERVRRAYERHAPLMEELGGRVAGPYATEGDPRDVTIFEEWPSEEAMQEASERYGAEFDAGRSVWL